MSLILNIETSTKACSISIFEKTNFIAGQTLMIEKSHSEFLLQMIDQLISNRKHPQPAFKGL